MKRQVSRFQKKKRKKKRGLKSNEKNNTLAVCLPLLPSDTRETRCCIRLDDRREVSV